MEITSSHEGETAECGRADKGYGSESGEAPSGGVEGDGVIASPREGVAGGDEGRRRIDRVGRGEDKGQVSQRQGGQHEPAACIGRGKEGEGRGEEEDDAGQRGDWDEEGLPQGSGIANCKGDTGGGNGPGNEGAAAEAREGQDCDHAAARES